jgi:hypothetical protein
MLSLPESGVLGSTGVTGFAAGHLPFTAALPVDVQ